MPLFLRLLCLFAAIPFAFTSCAKHETAVTRGDRDQILSRGMGPDLADLDPALATGTNDYTVLSALFEGLVAEDPVDLHPVPGVAASWEISADGLTYTFHLRTNARWSNGDPVTSHDFLASWQRVLTPSLGSANASLLAIVRGATAFNQGHITDFNQVGFAAPDDHTVIITLAHPAAYFLSLLQHWAWWPVHTPTLAKFGPLYTPGNPWAKPATFVGNGPFTLKEWKHGQRIVVEESPTYWDAAHVRLKEIRFFPIEDVGAEERAFRAGQLHLTETIPVGRIDDYRKNESQLLRIDPYLGTYFYRINTTRPFFKTREVRRALALAIDRAAIVKNILRGGQLPAYAFTPPDTAGYTPAAHLESNFDEARRLLTAAGYPGGKGAPTVEILYNNSENHRAIAEAIQAMWRTQLGLDVRLINMEARSALAARTTGDYQIMRSSWIGDYVDPLTFLSVWTSDSGNNYTGWHDADYDHLLAAAARTADRTARYALLQQAEALLVNAAPFIPIYYYTHVFLIRPSVHGWYPNLLDHHPYKDVWLQAPAR